MTRIVVTDTQLISFPTPRRFLIGVASLLDTVVYVVRQVVTESINTAKSSEVQEYYKLLDRAGVTDPEFKDRVAAKIDVAIREWVEDTFLSNSGPIRCVANDAKSIEMASNLADRIPPSLFMLERTPRFDGDIRVISESVVGGADLVFTNNRRSIEHALLNEWLIEEGYRSEPMIYRPNTGVLKLLGNHFSEYCHVAAIRMTLSNELREEEENLYSLNEFVEHLRGSMNVCADIIDREERSSTHRVERWLEAREAIIGNAWQLARGIEESRVQKVREAARETDWDLGL